MLKEFVLLEEKIKQLGKNRPIYYLANPGNYGDALIRYATIKFLRDIGVQYIELNSFRRKKIEWLSVIFRKKGILIYGGGGAWCNLWNFEFLLKKIEKHFHHIIVLPSTYEIEPTLLNATYFCRDKYESQETVKNALFCHDMALYLSKIKTEQGIGNGFFFRTDKESAKQINIPPTNIDISTQGDQYTPIYSFFKAISSYSDIYTDRLHVAIAGALLDKNVHLYPGAYYKNRAVYFSSLQNYNFNKIKFYENYNFNIQQIGLNNENINRK